MHYHNSFWMYKCVLEIICCSRSAIILTISMCPNQYVNRLRDEPVLRFRNDYMVNRTVHIAMVDVRTQIIEIPGQYSTHPIFQSMPRLIFGRTGMLSLCFWWVKPRTYITDNEDF